MTKIETINKQEEIKNKEDDVRMLQEIGISRIESLTLVALMHNKKMSAREIERWTDLRQPEVSIACKLLKEKGWIKEGNKIACTGKGRPQQVYELSHDQEWINNQLQMILERKRTDIEEQLKRFKSRNKKSLG